jgi:hypothetical protein
MVNITGGVRVCKFVYLYLFFRFGFVCIVVPLSSVISSRFVVLFSSVVLSELVVM